MTELAIRAKIALDNKRVVSNVDIAVAILISVVIGALLLACVCIYSLVKPFCQP